MASSTTSVPTPAGDARITWHRPPRGGTPRARAVLALGHGAGGGIEARDLQALAAALPPLGYVVALVEQPWRVAGKKIAPAPKTLDAAWTALWPELEKPGLPVIAGGRSAGARVACRTAHGLGAHAVLALSFPLHPPGRPARLPPPPADEALRATGPVKRSRAEELLDAGLPTLVVQGGRDAFGRPEEFPADLPEGTRLVEVAYGDHGFAVPKSADLTQGEALTGLTDAVAAWLDDLPGLRR